MRLSEALKITQAAPQDATPLRVALVSGYTPLHVQTFLAAHLQLAFPRRQVVVSPGVYGNVASTLEDVAKNSMDAVCVSLEWEDLDARLGFRSSGQWGPEVVNDILATVRSSLERLAQAVSRAASVSPVVVSPPSLPLPPLFHNAGFQSSRAELALELSIAEFMVNVVSEPRISAVNGRRLAEESPAGARYELKSDLAVGFPYSLAHAELLAKRMANNIAPPEPKKGIITDLDGTLWSGIVGEAGPEAVTWDLAGHAHLHALYQKLLGALAKEGVLLAIASKNDPAIVERALQRKDLLLSPDLVFPIEVHWKAKSNSVDRILKTWNIAAESAVFVDDSPMELAEVASAHPGIHTVLFPSDVSQGLSTLQSLRDLCGKAQLLQEDEIRRESIRSGTQFKQELASAEAIPEAFLQQLNSTITLDFDCAGSKRVFELVNKTNQFNLNGIRYTESEWRTLLSGNNSILLSTTYEDKFGPLGTIGVLLGQVNGTRCIVNTWVLSCRAFGRRIEHAMLRTLFDRLKIKEVEFVFMATAKNKPLQVFLTDIFGTQIIAPTVLTSEVFARNCPQLFQQIRELQEAETIV